MTAEDPKWRRRAALRLLIALVVSAVPIAAAAPGAAGGTQQGAGSATLPPASISMTLSPSAFMFTTGSEAEVREAVLTFEVDPSGVEDAIGFAVPDSLPGGLRLAVEPIGAPAVERDGSGRPSGTVRQRLRLSFSAIPARLDSVPILITATLGRSLRTVEISVTNLAGAASGASLAVAVPSDLRWSADQPIGLVLSASGAPAPGVAMAAGPFIETQTKRAAPLDFCLSEAVAGPCAQTVSLGANRPRNLFLLSRGARTIAPGAYTGTLRFLAGNGLKIDQTIMLEVTSGRWRLTGLAALVLGTMFSFLLSVLFPYQRTRELALRPIAALRERLETAAIRRHAASETRQLNTLSERIDAALEDKWLVKQGKIGSAWPSPYGGPPDAALLKGHLEAQAAWVAAIERLSDAIAADPDGAQRLDALAGESRTAAELDARLSDALGSKNTQAATISRISPTASLTLVEITLREDVRSAFTWFLSSLFSIALGYVILIDANPSFGGWTDVFGALLWALGLSVAGGKLAEVTSGPLRSTLRPAKAS